MARGHSDTTEPVGPAALSSRPRAPAREPGPGAKMHTSIPQPWVPDIALTRNSGMTVALADPRVLVMPRSAAPRAGVHIAMGGYAWLRCAQVLAGAAFTMPRSCMAPVIS